VSATPGWSVIYNTTQSSLTCPHILFRGVKNVTSISNGQGTTHWLPEEWHLRKPRWRIRGGTFWKCCRGEGGRATFLSLTRSVGPRLSDNSRTSCSTASHHNYPLFLNENETTSWGSRCCYYFKADDPKGSHTKIWRRSIKHPRFVIRFEIKTNYDRLMYVNGWMRHWHKVLVKY